MRKTPMPADCFVICTANSQTHLGALRDALLEFFETEQIKLIFFDKGKSYDWLIVDASSIVVHVFTKKGRAFFALEDLWTNSERISFGG